jgi:hypothetical protein
VRFFLALLLLSGAASLASAQGPTDDPPRPERSERVRPHERRAPRPRIDPALEREAARWWDPVSDAGQTATGLSLGASFVRLHGAERVVAMLRDTHTTAVVLDLKDGEGRVHHDTAVPELQDARTGWLGDVRALLRQLREAGVYTIARITCFADRHLPEIMPERAIRHVRHGRPWVSWGTGGTWLDPHNADNHRMIVQLSREAQALGFDEVQLDYVRFPVDDGTEFAVYPSQSDEPRPQVLMRLLRAIDEAISIPLGVDVFGLAAYRRGDPSGLGQDLEAWTQHVEVYTPMLYINSMREWRVGERNRAFNLVHDGTSMLRQRLGTRPIIRPFLQSFARGAGEEYTADFVTQQIRGARRAQADGFLFWHPGYSYGMVQRAMSGGGRRLVPFPISARTRMARRPASMLPSWIRR